MRKILRSKNAQTTKIRDGENSIKEVAGPGSGRTEGGDKKVFKPCGLECKSHCRTFQNLAYTLCPRDLKPVLE